MKKLILFLGLINHSLFAQPTINIQVTSKPVNQYLHGYCNELWQWSRQHQDIDVFSPTFHNNFQLLNSQYGTFNNAMACVHTVQATSGGTGYNYSGCKPFPNTATLVCCPPTSTVACTSPSDCSADGMGCYTHTFDCYDVTNQYYSTNGIAMGVNVNPYVSNWATQQLYISKPIQAGVNVISISAGNELHQPTWYGNSTYFPYAGFSYKNYLNNFYNTCKPVYPNIPILTWATDMWSPSNSIFRKWNDSVSIGLYDGIHTYALTRDIKKNLPQSPMSLDQLIDSVLTYEFWLNSWMVKKENIFDTVPVSFDTYGTQPDEPMVGGTFLGEMQTALQQICMQTYTGSTRIITAQEYRTRSYNLQSVSSATTGEVKTRNLRGQLFGYSSTIGKVTTTNSRVLGIASCEPNGDITCLMLNFDSSDHPANLLVNNVAPTSYTINGYYATNLLTNPDNCISYIGGSVIKAGSISLIKMKSITTNIAVPKNDITELTLFPNPVSETANLKFKSNYSTSIEIELYNTLGQLILNKTEKCSQGINQIELNTSQLQKGVYSLMIINGNHKESRKLIK